MKIIRAYVKALFFLFLCLRCLLYGTVVCILLIVTFGGINLMDDFIRDGAEQIHALDQFSGQ